MKILVAEITETPKETTVTEPTEELNRIYSGAARDFQFPPLLDAVVTYYRAGADLFFHGRVSGTLEGRCSRCLKGYSFPLDKQFDFMLAPAPAATKAKESKELDSGELGMSFYRGEEIELAPLIREQALLALPTRPLCDENCRGLCSSCGIDLNEKSCRCSVSRTDPRMAFFREMKLHQ